MIFRSLLTLISTIIICTIIVLILYYAKINLSPLFYVLLGGGVEITMMLIFKPYRE